MQGCIFILQHIHPVEKTHQLSKIVWKKEHCYFRKDICLKIGIKWKLKRWVFSPLNSTYLLHKVMHKSFIIMSHNNDLWSSKFSFYAPLFFLKDRRIDKDWKLWVIWITAPLLCLEFSYKYPIALRFIGLTETAGTISFVLL